MSDVVQWIRGESQVREALKERINEEHRRCEEAVGAALEHAIRAGEGLVQMKERVSHGEWRAWLREHFEGSERTAQAYMRLYQRRGQIRNGAADLTIRSALSSLSTPKPKALTQVVALAEVSDYKAEKRREFEKKLKDRGFKPRTAKGLAAAFVDSASSEKQTVGEEAEVFSEEVVVEPEPSPEDRAREGLFTVFEAIGSFHVLVQEVFEDYDAVVAFASEFSAEDRKAFIKTFANAKSVLNTYQRAFRDAGEEE